MHDYNLQSNNPTTISRHRGKNPRLSQEEVGYIENLFPINSDRKRWTRLSENIRVNKTQINFAVKVE